MIATHPCLRITHPPEIELAAGHEAIRRRSVSTPGEFDETAVQEFMEAIQEYKRRSGRMFPTWSEVLEVLRCLGYQKPDRA